jgi:SAM-dependent methyltransferase
MRAMSDDARQFAPATARNREPILEVLRRLLPPEGTVLEIASGTGEHAGFLAPHFPRLIWQPSDPDPGARASVAAWTAGIANVRPPLALDAASNRWPIAASDAVICINMIHIAPWAATQGLLAGASRILPAGGLLYLYGPYKRDGQHTAPSNAAFDASLRARNPAWGVRDLEAVSALASNSGFGSPGITPMPANNLSLSFLKVI